MKAVSTFVITVALVVGLVGCGPAPSPTPTQYNLTTSSTDGGEVTSPGEATFTYDEGTVVNLVAEAEEGYRFVEWTGDVDTIGNVSAAITTITMNGDHSVAANFASSVLIRVGSDFTDYGKHIAMDAEGNMYFAGYFQGTVDFDPGQDIVNKTAFGDPQGADGAGQVDIFLAKYDKYGLLIGVNTFGGNGPDMPHSMTLDKDGNIYIVGYIGGSFDIDTSSGARIVSSGVGRDILLAKFGNDGRFLWAHSFVTRNQNLPMRRGLKRE